MQKLWIHNIPCEKDLISLSQYYDDYENLKNFMHGIFLNSGIFEGISYNKKILIKPNWVFHNSSETDKWCLTTHGNFILAVLEFILLLKPNSVIIGDSPVQSCDWELLLTESFRMELKKIQKRSGTRIDVIDFRNEKWEHKKVLKKDCRGNDDYVVFDLKNGSMLDPLSTQGKTFVVGDYDPEIIKKHHNKGIHKYIIAKEVIEADIIINLPKLKTHQKAGLTNGLKNYVGTIGDKSCLAHHSSNLNKIGGDCFPGNNIIRKLAEYLTEISYKYKGKFRYKILHYSTSIIWRLAPKSDYANLSGAWYGNDTVWRMVMDINRIIKFGELNGELANLPQRKLITISDAIIAGQGEGPLKPTPNPIGMICISENDLLLDSVMATMMNFDFRKIPLLLSFQDSKNDSDFQIFMDGNRIEETDLKKYAVKTSPPSGWVGKIELI